MDNRIEPPDRLTDSACRSSTRLHRRCTAAARTPRPGLSPLCWSRVWHRHSRGTIGPAIDVRSFGSSSL